MTLNESFDLISYAAGLSCLHLWRFALATLAGVIPAAFLLAHFGAMATGNGTTASTFAILGIGVLTGAPIVWVAFRRNRR